MPPKIFNIALIGLGAVSKKHFAAVERLDNARVAAVCDVNAQAAKAKGEELGVPWYTDYMELAEKEDIDVFSLMTPSGVHAQNIYDLLKFGKDFIVEKPLTLDLLDARRAVEECDRAGCRLYVVQQNRFNPPVQKLKQALDAGRFGKIVLATVRVRWSRNQEYYDANPWRGTWEHDGGVLANQANHHMDMLTWLIGDVESVMGMSATRLVKIETEDTVAATLRFTNGALGIVEATMGTRPKDLEGSISVLGEKGAVEIGGFFMNELKIWNFAEKAEGDDEVFETHGSVPKVFAWNHGEYYRHVLASIEAGRSSLIDGLDGTKSLELISATYEAIETGKEVCLRFSPHFAKLGKRSGE